MMDSTPLLRLGIIADPQYAELPPNLELDRFYAASLGKIRQAVDHFNTEDLDAVIVLGDLIDCDAAHFDPVLAELERLRHPRILLPGNHDFDVAPEHLAGIHERLSMPAPYYVTQLKGLHLIIIDGSEISMFAPPPGDPRRLEAQARLAALKAAAVPNAHAWNAGISKDQEAWLKTTLADLEGKGECAIVLGHYPLFPLSDHNLWDSDDLARLLSSSPAVHAYFCGHDHRGGHAERDGTHFLTFKGMVDTATENAFAIVELWSDTLNITGFGREKSRSLILKKAVY